MARDDSLWCGSDVRVVYLLVELKVELEGKVSDTLRFNQEAAEAKEKCEQREKKLSQVIETLTR